MAEIKLSAEDVQAAVKEALAKAIPEHQARSMVAEAIHLLMERGNDRNMWDPTRLQNIFKEEASKTARKYVEEILSDPARQESIRSVVIAAWDKVFETEMKPKMVETLASALMATMAKERW